MPKRPRNREGAGKAPEAPREDPESHAAVGPFRTCPDTQSFQASDAFRGGHLLSMSSLDETPPTQISEPFWKISQRPCQIPGNKFSDSTRQPLFTYPDGVTKSDTDIDQQANILSHLSLTDSANGPWEEEIEALRLWEPNRNRRSSSDKPQAPISTEAMDMPAGYVMFAQGDAVLLNMMDQQRKPTSAWMDTLRQRQAQGGGSRSKAVEDFEMLEDDDSDSSGGVPNRK